MAKRISEKQPFKELVVGLVAPVGTDLDHVCELIRESFKAHGYDADEYHVSDFLSERKLKELCGYKLRSKSEHSRLNSYMTAGNKLREATRRADILALYAASKILENRELDEKGNPEPMIRRAHVIRSLKHPEEVKALRQIYSGGFFLLSVHCATELCVGFLTKRKGLTKKQAIAVIERDKHEENPWGQHTRKVFELGDIFLDFTTDEDIFRDSLRRVVDLIFGNPYETPTRHEHAMFIAYAASLRSGDLSRQVGAVVTSEHGDILATGANDVPRFGGGQYWPDKDDQRDSKWGVNSNEREKRRLATNVLREIAPHSNDAGDALFARYESKLRKSGILDITEYGRSVHAEMEALSSCLRNGISVLGCVLYSTTFPCHNCAKHLIGAGIKEVHYVEPYPKSLAVELHSDAISLTSDRNKVIFKAFVGVGPRRYVDLFSLKLGSGRPLFREHDDGTVLKRDEWKNQGPRVPMIPLTYIEEEEDAAEELAKVLT